MLWNDFLDVPIDYSESFTDHVGDLARSVSSALGVVVHHRTDMNYNPGQMLIVYLLSDGSVTADPRAAFFSLRIAVSSRGPLWAVLASRKGDRDLEWLPSPVDELETGCASDVLAAVIRIMAEAGLDRVADGDLEQLLPAKVTQLDGAPATVLDFFFCESC